MVCLSAIIPNSDSETSTRLGRVSRCFGHDEAEDFPSGRRARAFWTFPDLEVSFMMSFQVYFSGLETRLTRNTIIRI